MPRANQSLYPTLVGPPCLPQQCLFKHFPKPVALTLSQVNLTVINFIERTVVGFP